MKTEPIEAMNYIASYSCENGAGDMIIDREDAEEAVRFAYKEGQFSPKIKQLEWEELSREIIEADYEYPPESVFKAATPFMYYTIHKSFPNTFKIMVIRKYIHLSKKLKPQHSVILGKG